MKLENELNKIEILPEGKPAEFCDYIHKCSKACFKVKAQSCGLRRFYDRYGTENYLFVGSRV